MFGRGTLSSTTQIQDRLGSAWQSWTNTLGSRPVYIAPGSSWENGYAEILNRRLRDEFLGCEIFADVRSTQVLGTAWRIVYNEWRPHSSLGYRTPAEFAKACVVSIPATPQPPFQQHTSLQT